MHLSISGGRGNLILYALMRGETMRDKGEKNGKKCLLDGKNYQLFLIRKI